ncbi:MAG TPA: Mur ligase domain-containing protein, partial [Allocoleopsis sp.]
MPCQLSVTQLVDILAATPVSVSDRTAETLSTGITTDTRSLQPGHVFLALRGETFDGHDFARGAVEKGAIAAIVDRRMASQLDGIPQLQVEDTLQAYQQIARW